MECLDQEKNFSPPEKKFFALSFGLDSSLIVQIAISDFKDKWFILFVTTPIKLILINQYFRI